MAKTDFPASGGGGVENKIEREEAVFGIEYLESKQNDLDVEIGNIRKQIINEEEFLKAYDNGAWENDKYVVDNAVTGKEGFFYKGFLEQRNKVHKSVGTAIETRDDLVEKYRPVLNNNLDNQIKALQNTIIDIDEDKKKLAVFYKEELATINFISAEVLLSSVDFSQRSYIEIIAIVGKFISGNQDNFAEINKLFTQATESRIQIAIIELLPRFFKNTQTSDAAQKLIADIVTDFSLIKDDNKVDYLSEDDEKYIDYGTYRDEDEQYDRFITAVIVNLAKFGEESEDNLWKIFKYLNNEEQNYFDKEIDGINIASFRDAQGEGDLYYGVDIDRDGDLIDDELKANNYYYSAKLLFFLNSVGTRKSVDFVADAIENSDYIIFNYKQEILEIFRTVDSNYSAKRLLQLMKSGEDSARKQAGKLLFMLEVGKINISEEGVQYLDKMYDLQELNNPNFFVERLTNMGDLGIFNQEGVLQKFFTVKTEDLISKEGIIIPEVMELTIRELFYTQTDESGEMRAEREKFLQEFKEKYFSLYNESFKNITGVRFNDFELKEQGQFLIYYEGANKKKRQELLNFISKYRENGLRTFLSLEHGGLEMGDVILKIGEQLRYNPEIANRVFGQYLEMVDGVENEVNDLVKMYNNIFFDKQIDEDRARQAILKKANLILQKSLKRLEGASDDKKADIIDELIADLKRQAEVEKQSLEHLRSLAKRLNDLYNQIGNQIIGEDLVKELHRAREDNFGGIDEKYLKKIDDDYARHQKYDSKRIKGDIEFLKTMYTLSAEQEMAIRSLPDVTDDMMARIHVNNEKDRMEYESQVAKLEKLLKLQEELEGALEEYIYDQKVEPDDIDNSDVSSRVMKRYQELVEEAKKNREELRLLFGDEIKLTEEDLNRISNNILKEAKQVLDDYVERAINDKVGVDEQEALSVLEGASVKINVLSSILKLVKEKGNYSGGLEVVKNLDIEFKDLGSDFDEDGEKSKMIKNLIIKQAIIGRQKEGESIQQVEKQAGVMDTKEALENVKNIRTYILKYKGDIIGFAYFQSTYIDENNNQHYYASGLNILKNIQGLDVGANFMESVLMVEAQKPRQIIDALTSIDKKVTTHYIEKLPFNINGFKDDYKDGKPRFSITINLKKLKQLKTKEMSVEAIEEFAQTMNFVEIIKKMSNQEDSIFVKYNMTHNSVDDFINQIKNILPNKNVKKEQQNVNIKKYYMTRYFDSVNDGVDYRYVVFERKK